MFGKIWDATAGKIANGIGKMAGNILDKVGLKNTVLQLAVMLDGIPGLNQIAPFDLVDDVLNGDIQLNEALEIASFVAGGGIPGMNAAFPGLANGSALGAFGGLGGPEMQSLFGALSGNSLLDLNNPVVQQHLTSLLQAQLGSANV